MARRLPALIVLFCLGLSARAEDLLTRKVELPGEVPALAKRLEAADRRLAQKEWAGAVDEYQHLLDEAADNLVPVDPKDPRHCVSARRLCHQRLASLPAAALRLYRSRVDGRARQWLEQGRAARDPALLRRLVDETFCSRFTDQALDLLGDLAFERGDFDGAEQWWHMLGPPQPPAAAEPLELTFPDSQVDLARVRAKLLLTQLFRGERARFLAGLAGFRKAYAGARGSLAGRDGVYAETLQALADKPDLIAPGAREKDWPTFAGSPARGFIAPEPPGRLARLRPLDEPHWRVRLDPSDEPRKPDGESGKVLPVSRAARSLAFHPIVVGRRVLVADAVHVTAYELLTGRVDFRYDLLADGRRKLAFSPAFPPEPDSGYTLTATEDRVYARLGDPGLGRKGDEPGSFLVCLNLVPGTAGERERWVIRPEPENGVYPAFEGAPVTALGRVYAAQSLSQGERTVTAVACYDADAGALRWRQDVCKTTEPRAGERRYRHHLLTLAGSHVIYCAHSGAVVALDAATGRRAWAVRYASRGPQTAEHEPSPRGLAPCVAAGGRLFIAPLDYDRILCLDTETGRQLWESEPLEVLHLLGVARDRLIFTTLTPNAGIRALEASTGRPLRDWVHPADGSELPTFGRGLLAGDLVLWPTRDGLRMLRQDDGEPLLLDGLGSFSAGDPLHFLGNLAVGHGCLVVAGTEDLSVYVPDGDLTPTRKQEAAGRPPARDRVSPRPTVLKPTTSAAGLALPLARAWHVSLASDDTTAVCWLAEEDRPCVIATGAGASVMCYDPASGKRRWARGLGYTPSWIAPLAGALLVAGADGVSSLRLADGQLRWELGAPDLRPAAEQDQGRPVPALTEFSLLGPRLFFLQGGRRLFAVDAVEGRVFWSAWAPGARVRPLAPGGRFASGYHVSEERLLLQTGMGRQLLLEAGTGQVVHEAPTARADWPRPVVSLTADRVGLVPDPSHLVCLDLRSGKEVWTYVLGGWPSLSGEAPQVKFGAQAVLLLVPRNYGYELECLDTDTGTRRWRAPGVVSTRAAAVEAVDARAAYVVGRDTLAAYSLRDGNLVWQMPMPGQPTNWRVRRAGQWLAVYPYEATAGEPFALWLCDPADGRLVQRLNFPAADGPAEVDFSERGLAVMLGSQAWGFAPAGSR